MFISAIERNDMGVDLQQPFSEERAAMVEQQLRRRGIIDERVLEAMSKVPRHEFLHPASRQSAYLDQPIAIGEKQTTSQPYIIAAMLQAASIHPEDRVLEIGAGSGYQTAILCELAAHVIAVERFETLTRDASAVLANLGYKNVEIKTGDGSLGWPAGVPYNAIIVSAASPFIPPALVDQLARGGRLVVPVGSAHEQALQLLVKEQDGSTLSRTLEGCRFVPLIGQQGFAA
jgi:protein-L-isoaspartate(D-aspartate) O-methyltransferase